jgi:tetratricopeptide (TPR) repeat protein
MLPRILELGLTYHLAASRYRDIWPDRSAADAAVARHWHERLQEILQQQRGEVPREEISRRALAMEIIGFRLLRTPRGESSEASESIVAFARDLHAEIGRSNDKCAELIKVALDSVSRSQRDLVSAPIWGSHPTEWIVELADEPKAAELMTRGYANLTRIAGGSQKAAVTSLERDVLEEISRDFAEASDALQARVLRGQERAREASFYTRMEVCYAKLLLALIDEDNRNAKLEQLIADYEAISRDYPKASIPHFRLDSIYSELGKNDLAFDELTTAVNLVDDDPFLRIPGHWVHSTIRRRVGARFSEEAAQQRRKLSEQPELREGYLQNLLLAFRNVHAGADRLPEQHSDVLYALERRRRINNVLYYASLVLEVCPGPEGFRQLGIDRGEMNLLLSQLMRGDVTSLSEIGIIHTIGAAYAALGEKEAAAAAGNHLVNVAKETAEATRMTNFLNDAFTWIQRRNTMDPMTGDTANSFDTVMQPETSKQ